VERAAFLWRPFSSKRYIQKTLDRSASHAGGKVMKRIDYELRPIDELWILHQEINSKLATNRLVCLQFTHSRHETCIQMG
jgi:hypothetical protein